MSSLIQVAPAVLIVTKTGNRFQSCLIWQQWNLLIMITLNLTFVTAYDLYKIEVLFLGQVALIPLAPIPI